MPQFATLPAMFSDVVQTAFGFGAGASLTNPFILFAAVVVLGVAVAWAAVRRIEAR